MGLWCETATRHRWPSSEGTSSEDGEIEPAPPTARGSPRGSAAGGSALHPHRESLDQQDEDESDAPDLSDEALLDLVLGALGHADQPRQQQEPQAPAQLRWHRRAPTADEIRRTVRPDVLAAGSAGMRATRRAHADLAARIDSLARAHGAGEASARVERAGARAWRERLQGEVQEGRREAAEGIQRVLEAIRGLGRDQGTIRDAEGARGRKAIKAVLGAETPGSAVASRVPGVPPVATADGSI